MIATSEHAELMDAEEVVRYLKLPSRRAVYQGVRRGEIPAYRLGKRRLRFRRDELEKLLKKSNEK